MRKSRPVPDAPPERGLPATAPLLGALGLAVLALCTLPAVRAQERLDAPRDRLETRAVEVEIERLQREVREGTSAHYARTRSTRDLLHRGASYLETRDQRLEQRAAAADGVEPSPAAVPPMR
ncbi:MAG: hypothetical protein O2894_12230 [Planctomycetota bacterium]|nr:hypothetical protein [Planctomycetota bacterium]